MSDPTQRERELDCLLRDLWPHIRHWGLCGACPEAIDVMLRVASQIGEKPDAEQRIARREQSVREEMLNRVAEFLEGHIYNGRKIRREDMDTLIKQMMADPSLAVA